MGAARLALFAILFAFLLPAVASAQSGSAKYDLSRLAGLCDNVYQNFEAERPFRYAYEQQIVEAARIPAHEISAALKDAKSNAAQRIRDMWQFALADPDGPLFCDQSNFDVSNGYVLKYAIKMQNFRFLAQAVQIWGVPLNQVHATGASVLRYGTVADYLQAEIDRMQGGEGEESLRTYYRLVRRHGGLHAAELKK